MEDKRKEGWVYITPPKRKPASAEELAARRKLFKALEPIIEPYLNQDYVPGKQED